MTIKGVISFIYKELLHWLEKLNKKSKNTHEQTVPSKININTRNYSYIPWEWEIWKLKAKLYENFQLSSPMYYIYEWLF